MLRLGSARTFVFNVRPPLPAVGKGESDACLYRRGIPCRSVFACKAALQAQNARGAHPLLRSDPLRTDHRAVLKPLELDVGGSGRERSSTRPPNDHIRITGALWVCSRSHSRGSSDATTLVASTQVRSDKQ